MKKLTKQILAFLLSITIILCNNYYAYAGLPAPVRDYAVKITNVAKNSIGVNANFAFKKAANDTTYAATKSISSTAVAKTFLGRFTRFGIQSVGFYAVEQLLRGTDWIMDADEQSIYRKRPSFEYCKTSRGEEVCFDSARAIVDHFLGHLDFGDRQIIIDNWTEITPRKSPDRIMQELARSDRGTTSVTIKYAGTGYEVYPRNPDKHYPTNTSHVLEVYAKASTGGKELMSDSDLGQILREQASAADYETMIQPQPDVAPANDPAYDYIYDDAASDAKPVAQTDTETNPDPDTETNPDPDPETDPVTDPDPETENKPFEFPKFCDWAKPVCDFVDWFKNDTDDPTDIDIDDPDLPNVDTKINFGGQCPNDIILTFDIYQRNVEFPLMQYSKLCPILSSYIRPMLILLGSFFAVMIVGRFNDG